MSRIEGESARCRIGFPIRRLLFGGEVIRGFVFAIMFGVIIGTLSSIFIATPVAYDLMNKQAAKKAKK